MHPIKAFLFISANDSGRVILDRLTHLANAEVPILSILEHSVTLLNEGQSEKQQSPIFETEPDTITVLMTFK